MQSKRIILALGGLITLFTVNTSFAGIIAGIEVEGKSLTANTSGGQVLAVTPPPQGATVINFDNVAAACLWNSTSSRLTNEYAAQGVVFSGPGGLDGGAIIDECGFFPVSGYSSPNFLAFNTTGTFIDSGHPLGPETMVFNPPVAFVQINASVGTGDVSMECFSGMNSVGTDTIPSSSQLETLSVTTAGIDRCVLSWSASVAVFDDLAFSNSTASFLPVTIPTLGTWALMILALLLGIIGFRSGVLQRKQ